MGSWDRVDVLGLENGLILLKFESDQSKSWVLEGGPWFMALRPLLLRQWTPGISLEKLDSTKMPLWVNLRGVPMELFTIEGINHVASGIGVPLFKDKATESRPRLLFARVCVEVDHTNDLPSIILVEIEDFGYFVVSMEYPWRPLHENNARLASQNSKFCSLSAKSWSSR